MKKLYKIALIGFVPLILGFVLLITGGVVNNDTLVYAGSMILSIGFPVTLFILVVVGIILAITGKLSDNQNGSEADVTGALEEQNEDGETEAVKEQRALEDINSAYGYASQYKMGEYEIDHTAKIYRNSNFKEKVFSWILFGFLMTAFGLAFVSILMNQMIPFFICGGVFAGTILICLIVKTVMEKTSQSSKVNPKKYVYKTATVKACLLSSMSSTGGTHNSTVRVGSVTYRILLDIDGKRYNAYSKKVYETGERIEVAVKKNGKGVAKIVAKPPEENE